MFIAIFFTENLSNIMDPFIQGLKRQISSGQVTLTYNSIFLNNISSVFRMYIGGLFFGILPFISLVFNGLLVGYFIGRGPVLIVLLYIVPHGIFEIPAIIIASAAGFTLLKFVLNFLHKLIKPDYAYINENNIKTNDGVLINKDNISFKNKIIISWGKNKHILIDSLVLLAISAILIVIAAFIEVYITPGFAHYFIKNFHSI